jgi:Gpi18-like mannosyltransferase
MIFKITEVLTNPNTALITSFLWIIYPIAYVDNLAYSETLFTALVATTLYCWHRGAIKSATLFALLAGLTRPTGLALVAAIVIPAIYDLITNARSRRSFSYYFAIFASGSGWFAYILYLAHKNNNLFSYFSVQSNWGNGFDGGRHFLSWISHYLPSRDWYLGILLLMALALGIYLLVGLYKNTRFAPMLIFATLLFILAFSTQGYFGSKARYLLPDFPLLIPIAVVIQNMKRPTKFISYGLLTMLGLTFGAIAATGHGPP